jgi:hypothetical protein
MLGCEMTYILGMWAFDMVYPNTSIFPRQYAVPVRSAFIHLQPTSRNFTHKNLKLDV